jgi:hypothetical protein
MENTFTKANLTQHKGWVEYSGPSGSHKFVARFKYGTPHTFMTLLRKKFTVTEYFDRLDNKETPAAIAESKGWVSPAIKKALKKAGYPLTPAGKNLYFANQAAAYSNV